MKRDDSKLRILLIERMLRYDRVISSGEIIRRLEERGIFANRKTIYDDIRAINRVIPIETTSGKNGGFRRIDVLARCKDGN